MVTRTHALLNRSSGTESDDNVRLFHRVADYFSARESCGCGPHVRFERSAAKFCCTMCDWFVAAIRDWSAIGIRDWFISVAPAAIHFHEHR